MKLPLPFPRNAALRIGASLLMLAFTAPDSQAADDVDIACDFVGDTDEVKCYDMDKINACLSGDQEGSCFNPENEADKIGGARVKRLQSTQTLKRKQ